MTDITPLSGTGGSDRLAGLGDQINLTKATITKGGGLIRGEKDRRAASRAQRRHGDLLGLPGCWCLRQAVMRRRESHAFGAACYSGQSYKPGGGSLGPGRACRLTAVRFSPANWPTLRPAFVRSDPACQQPEPAEILTVSRRSRRPSLD
ncbi:hypothetical protein SRHO_G00189920 [Serrasalmus rhombeus]